MPRTFRIALRRHRSLLYLDLLCLALPYVDLRPLLPRAFGFGGWDIWDVKVPVESDDETLYQQLSNLLSNPFPNCLSTHGFFTRKREFGRKPSVCSFLMEYRDLTVCFWLEADFPRGVCVQR